MDYLSEFRDVALDYCQHVRFLQRYAKAKPKDVDMFVMRARVGKVLKDKKRIEEAFRVLIKGMLASAKINLVVENLPEYGTSVRDDLPERVTGRAMHDTMAQFGNVSDTVVFKNHAYVWFEKNEEAKYACGLINNMQMGNKIIGACTVTM